MARIPWRAALAALALAVVPGCSSSGPSVPEGVLRSQIVLSVTPSPLVPVSAVPPVFSIRYTVKIAEIAGLGGEIQYVNGTVFDDVSGLTVAVNNYDDSDILVFVGSKRIDGGQSRDVNQQIDYALPLNSTKAILTINVQFKDDRGNFVTQSILVRVAT
jgi:hypothetical protein